MSNANEETLHHALFLAQHLNKCDVQYGLVYILIELEMPSYHIGYHYVKNAILQFYQNPVPMLLSGIYQAVSEKVDPSANYKQMEGAMRYVIREAYQNCDSEVWRYYFRKRKRKPPNNYDFISQIANFMELWQGCCQEVSYEI